MIVDINTEASGWSRGRWEEEGRSYQLSARNCMSAQVPGHRDGNLMVLWMLSQGMLRIMQDAKKQIVYRAIGKKELEV